MKKLSIIDILDCLGTSPKYTGYKYIIDSTIMMSDLVNNKKKIVLSDLFSKIANKYHTNLLCVERDTRICVEGLFKNGNLNTIDMIFKNISSYYDDRPSNKLFLTTIVNYLNKNK
jgi:two-component system response regulator (stage 0 sporulation protein A)